jgi:putative alpha-1,2-mannosidase
LNQVWFRHADLVNGGTLKLQMGDTPNTALGSDPATFPPSTMSTDTKEF